MSRKAVFTARALGLAVVALAVAACGGRQSADRAEVEYKGTDPSAPEQSADTGGSTGGSGRSGGGGIVSYDGYQAAAARKGETVADVANRIGLSAAELGAYNGLPPDHELRAGDELVLPPRPDGYGAGTEQASGETAPGDRHRHV